MQAVQILTAQEQDALYELKSFIESVCGKGAFTLRLFGSRARSEGDEDSDLDVLVLLHHYLDNHKIAIWDKAYEIFGRTGIYISPLVLSRDYYEDLKRRERFIAQEIEKEGIAI